MGTMARYLAVFLFVSGSIMLWAHREYGYDSGVAPVERSYERHYERNYEPYAEPEHTPFRLGAVYFAYGSHLIPNEGLKEVSEIAGALSRRMDYGFERENANYRI